MANDSILQQQGRFDVPESVGYIRGLALTSGRSLLWSTTYARAPHTRTVYANKINGLWQCTEKRETTNYDTGRAQRARMNSKEEHMPSVRCFSNTNNMKAQLALCATCCKKFERRIRLIKRNKFP